MTALNPENELELGGEIRALLRSCFTASLATLEARPAAQAQPDDGADSPAVQPYCSLVLVAVNHDANPLMLLSDLADHTKNLKKKSTASLLFDGTEGRQDRLSGARVTLQGQVTAIESQTLKARFVSQHPTAEIYKDFKDFRLYRMAVERGHLVAGFGRIHWVGKEKILFDASACLGLAEAEPEIVSHMNQDHADAVDLMAAQAQGLKAPEEGWIMTAVDPEGTDLLKAGRRLRISFEKLARDAESCRVELVRLTKKARQQIES